MERKEFKQVFNQRLDEFLDEKIDNLRPYFFDEKLEKMTTYIKDFAKGGKRFRPYLVYLFYKLHGGEEDERILDITLTNELIHLFGLIHDDISDQGTTRHGIPTYHKYVEEVLGDEFHGLSQTIWLGNLVYTRAMNHFTSLVENRFVKKLLFDMIEETVYGQIVDIHLSYTKELCSPHMIKFKDKWKSGYYSFKKPMMLGAALAGIRDLSKVEEMGEDLGLAFQMRDDLLDVVDGHGNKTSFSDHQEGNQTFLLHYCLEKSNESDKKMLENTRGKHLSEEEIEQLRKIFESTGTIEFAKKEVNKLLDLSIERLKKITDSENEFKNHIEFIIDYLRV